MDQINMNNMNRRLDEIIVTFNKEISQKLPTVIENHKIDYYAREIQPVSKLHGYQYVSPDLRTLFNKLERNCRPHELALIHKATLAFSMRESLKAKTYLAYPNCIKILFEEWYERIIADFFSQPDDYYDFANETFMKDLSCCSLRAIPVGGPWVVEKFGVGYKFLLKGLRQFIGGIPFILFKTRGVTPFYVIHTSNRYLHVFNSTERNKCYIRVAELLKCNREMKGFLGSSWFIDPALETVSPRLAYLRKIPEENGAKVFLHLGVTESATKNALLKSDTRRKLYEEGKYIPRDYAVIWPRQEMINWADKNRDLIQL